MPRTKVRGIFYEIFMRGCTDPTHRCRGNAKKLQGKFCSPILQIRAVNINEKILRTKSTEEIFYRRNAFASAK